MPWQFYLGVVMFTTPIWVSFLYVSKVEGWPTALIVMGTAVFFTTIVLAGFLLTLKFAP